MIDKLKKIKKKFKQFKEAVEKVSKDDSDIKLAIDANSSTINTDSKNRAFNADYEPTLDELKDLQNLFKSQYQRRKIGIQKSYTHGMISTSEQLCDENEFETFFIKKND